MNPAQRFADLLIDDPVLFNGGFPTHAPDQANIFHLISLLFISAFDNLYEQIPLRFTDRLKAHLLVDMIGSRVQQICVQKAEFIPHIKQ